jgi:hypothetical protein
MPPGRVVKELLRRSGVARVAGGAGRCRGPRDVRADGPGRWRLPAARRVGSAFGSGSGSGRTAASGDSRFFFSAAMLIPKPVAISSGVARSGPGTGEASGEASGLPPARQQTGIGLGQLGRRRQADIGLGVGVGRVGVRSRRAGLVRQSGRSPGSRPNRQPLGRLRQPEPPRAGRTGGHRHHDEDRPGDGERRRRRPRARWPLRISRPSADRRPEAKAPQRVGGSRGRTRRGSPGPSRCHRVWTAISPAGTSDRRQSWRPSSRPPVQRPPAAAATAETRWPAAQQSTNEPRLPTATADRCRWLSV